jgi:nitrate/nitrite-specific signal transduction histidine kinase
MKKLLFASLLLVSFGVLAQDGMSPAGAVNASGKQRMLSQRMGKDFLCLHTGIQVEAAQKEMLSAQVIFDENLKALKQFAPNDAIRAKLSREEEVWKKYKDLLNQPPTDKNNAQNVLDMNTQMLMAAEDVVQEIVRYVSTLPDRSETITGAAVAKNTNISGRVRMLSQRLTMYYIAFMSNIGEPVSQLAVMKESAEKIQGILSSLVTSEINSSDIDDAISEVIIDWRQIEERCTINDCISFEKKNVDPKSMFLITNRVVSKSDKVVGMYAKLLD